MIKTNVKLIIRISWLDHVQRSKSITKDAPEWKPETKRLLGEKKNDV